MVGKLGEDGASVSPLYVLPANREEGLMDVSVHDLEGQLGNNGILLRVYDPGWKKARGRLKIGKGTLRWYPGKTSKNYKSATWEELIEWLESK